LQKAHILQLQQGIPIEEQSEQLNISTEVVQTFIRALESLPVH